MSPSAGGRLCRLVWHGPNGDLELLVPVNTAEPFDEDHWPKQGAFPMLPYANRLKGASFSWEGNTHRVRAAPGHTHGLHGAGHRQSWQMVECHASAVRLSWRHAADGIEWPWSFTATLDYSLSASGLAVALAITNEAATPMPAVLGWHPYVPASWLQVATLEGAASAVHVVCSDGICRAAAPERTAGFASAFFDVPAPHTLALQGWHSTWSMQAAGGERWCLSADAAHLVHHVPSDLAYLCIEPVTALPGALGARTDLYASQDIALMPGARRELACRLMGAA